MKSVAVVGASLAGLRAAEALRREGFDGAVRLIGDEAHLPYDRPPLSKQLLAGEWEAERIVLADQEKLDELQVEFVTGRASSLDIGTTTVQLDERDSIAADGVVIATGARPRMIGEARPGVFTMRTLDDAIGLRRVFEEGPQRVVVIGAGFIGAEVAATAREAGLEVSMIEAAPAPFERSLGVEMGGVLADVHRDHGVDLRMGVGCDEILGADRVEGVRLSDGTTLDADVVVVGIGVIPNTEWLDGSGLDISNGVLCDATLAAAPQVVAAGDVARWPNELFGETMRIEHWDNATAQGVHAAKRLLTGPDVGAFVSVPWFWTDQYDRKIQLAGRTAGFDEVTLVEGSIEERRFVVLYRRQDRLVGVLGFNRPRHVMRYRMLIEQRVGWAEALEADI